MVGIIGSFRLYLLIVPLLLASCAKAQENSSINLKGTWIGCDKDGVYVEFHFSEYESLFVDEDIIDLTYAIPYSVVEDKIHYTNVRLQKNFTSSFQLEGVSLIIRNEYQNYRLKRLSDFPIVPMESRQLGHNTSFSDSVLFVHYQRMFELRESEYECADN